MVFFMLCVVIKIFKHNMIQSNSQFNMLFLPSSVVSRCCKKETTELMLKGMGPTRKQITIHSSPWPFTQTNQRHFKDSLLSSDSENRLYKYPCVYGTLTPLLTCSRPCLRFSAQYIALPVWLSPPWHNSLCLFVHLICLTIWEWDGKPLPFVLYGSHT